MLFVMNTTHRLLLHPVITILCNHITSVQAITNASVIIYSGADESYPDSVGDVPLHPPLLYCYTTHRDLCATQSHINAALLCSHVCVNQLVLEM